MTDYRNADITPLEKLMLTYAEKITREPAQIDQAYVDFLKGQGFSDQMLHDVVQVAAYFAYVNRVADALGVELESAG